MNDDYSELYNMLSLDRDEVIKIREAYQQDISVLMVKYEVIILIILIFQLITI